MRALLSHQFRLAMSHMRFPSTVQHTLHTGMTAVYGKASRLSTTDEALAEGSVSHKPHFGCAARHRRRLNCVLCVCLCVCFNVVFVTNVAAPLTGLLFFRFSSAQDMYEYLVASQMWHSLMESATSEQSSRMNAMENASKNAGEMIDSLTLIYNRARQSRITTELIEIISGASALEE